MPHHVPLNDPNRLDATAAPAAGFVSQFAASMKKNFLQKKNKPVGCLVETLLPAVFVIGLIFIWLATNPEEHDGRMLGSIDYVARMHSLQSPVVTMPKVACIKDNTTFPSDGPAKLSNCDDFKLGNITVGNETVTVEALSEPRCLSMVSHRATVDGLCFKGDPSGVLGPYGFDFNGPRLIPTMDELILAKWAALARWERPLGMAGRRGDPKAMRTQGYIYFSPDTPQVRAFIDHLRNHSAYFKNVYGGIFKTESEMEDHVTDSSDETGNEGMNWAGVHIEEMSQERLRFRIRANRTVVQDQDEKAMATLYSGGILDNNKWLFLSGVATLQKEVSDYYTTVIKALPLPAEPVQAQMGFIDWEQKIFLQTAGGIAPLMLVLSFLYPVSQLVKAIVLEKETGIREAMQIMSLGTGSFYLSWFLTYAIQFLITSILCTILMAATFLPDSNPVIVFVAFYLFSLSSIALAAMLASMFSKARVASLMSPVVFFLLAMPMFATENASAGLIWLLCFLSPSAFSVSLQLLFNHEQSTGLGAGELASSADTVPMIGALIMLAFDTVLYVLLTLYFDAVLPSDFGTRRHPLFCFIQPFRWLTGRKGDDTIPPDSRDPNGVFEDESHSANPVSVRIQGLRKQFTRGAETFLAVNNMHLNLRENEVNVLLGHNGAGKSTTMNMMTGMIEIDQGDCTVYGKSVKTEGAAVHKLIGYCPQRNILWPELTCYQHLDFFATIKGVPAEQRDEEIRKMITAVDLGDKIEYPSGALSGGQKRKLAVAIAFIGGSKLVFLDEPTAGMDVAARRHTWDVIKQMTPGRTILLTTHFMDEADLLGHTISIMSKGMLKCSGSSVFLKSRLGVGYSLNMSVDPSVDHAPLTSAIKSHIRQAEVLPCGAGELAFRLPVSSTNAFPALLQKLESNGASMGCKNFGVTVTTLEEVFLKIADEEEPATPAVGAPPSASGFSDTTAVEMKAAAGSDNHDELWRVQTQQRDVPTVILFKGQFIANLRKRFHNARRDRRTQMLQIVVPVVCVLLSMLFTLLTFTNLKIWDIKPSIYHPYGIDSQTFETVNCDNYINPTYWDKDLVHAERNFTNSTVLAEHYVTTFKHHGKERFNGMFCNDRALAAALGRTTDASMLFHNTTGFYASLDVTNQYYRNYIKSRNNSATDLELEIEAWPLTDREDAVQSSIRTLLIGIIILIPFTFIPSTYVAFIVKETETHAKHLQTSSGLNFFVYWFSNLVFDFISFTITAFLVIIVFLIFNREEYIGSGEAFAAIFLLFVFYGLASIASSYLISFAFTEHSQAQNIVMLSNFIAGFLLVLVIFILESIESTEDAAIVLKYFFRFIPSYCLGEGIINMATADLVKAFGGESNVFSMDVTGWPMLYMALEFPVFMVATLLIDHPSRRMKQQRLLHNPNEMPDTVEKEDVDVKAERRLIESADPSRCGDLVTVKHLSKVYPGGKKAVKNLSFGVKKGEVFGFLGTNGAGKTTTMSILCGEHMPTTGHCAVAGYDVVEQALQAQRNIGYCPQFDATLDLLTVKEHLELYSAIRGLDSDAAGVVVPGLMDVCGLSTYKDVIASALSGGNRRKLSVAISLIGGPRVVFLDEPSAGMDPMARRGMWEVIDHVSTQCAVVLTTHHLEEVEALAHRVAIMVDGTIRCIGDKTHLKNKFGSGFEMVVRLENESACPMLEKFVKSQMPNATLDEKRGGKYTYALPPSTKLSQAFQQIESVRAELGIADYCISQTSLEQVFLRISEAALEEEDVNSADPTTLLVPDAQQSSAPSDEVPRRPSPLPWHATHRAEPYNVGPSCAANSGSNYGSVERDAFSQASPTIPTSDTSRRDLHARAITDELL